jgi:hypothetical protein
MGCDACSERIIFHALYDHAYADFSCKQLNDEGSYRFFLYQMDEQEKQFSANAGSNLYNVHSVYFPVKSLD